MYIMINHYYTFTGLEFYNFTIFDQNKCFKIFGKVKKNKNPSGIQNLDL